MAGHTHTDAHLLLLGAQTDVLYVYRMDAMNPFPCHDMERASCRTRSVSRLALEILYHQDKKRDGRVSEEELH